MERMIYITEDAEYTIDPLPFGISTSPGVYMDIMRSSDIPRYLDDALASEASTDLLVARMEEAIEALEYAFMEWFLIEDHSEDEEDSEEDPDLV